MARSRSFGPVQGLPDRSQLLERLGRYTRFVRLSKLLLSLAILLLLGTVIVLPLLKGDKAGMRLVFAGSEEAPATSPVMSKPRYQGTDSKMQPYMVTADQAIQQDENTVILQNVEADMTLGDASWLVVHAAQGTIDMATEGLLLNGKVQLYHDGGYEVTTERVSVDMRGGMARVDMELEAHGPIGYIHAKGLTVYDRGERFVFDGPVSLIIHPEKK